MLTALLLSLSATSRMVVEMSRALDTCDLQDLAIDNAGTTRLIYAYSNKQPVKNIPTKHTQRGTQSIRLTSPGQAAFNPPETDVTSFNIGYKSFHVPFDSPVTGPTTTYYCGVFQLPTFSQTRQIIRFEPSIIPQINLGTVHHILIYECTDINATLSNYRGHCYGDNVPQAVQTCNAGVPIGAWAVGGLGTTFPSHLGYPLKPSSKPHHILMEIHYNNPTQRQVVDQSGLRFYTTAQLRQYDAGIIAFGHTVDAAFSIPAGKVASVVDSYCPGSCTSQTFPPGGIKIVAGMLHSHLAGRSINFTLIRGGKESVILKDKYYNFNLQDTEFLTQEITVLPGDTLRVQCTYNTQDRTQPTVFGLSTQNEMCLAYAMYYPTLSSNASSTMCVYANYSTIPGEQNSYGNLVSCFGDVQTQVTVPSFTPVPAPPCKRLTLPASRFSSHTFAGLKGFQPNKYAHNMFLDAGKTYKLYWTMDIPNKLIRMAVEVNKTVGWVGLGVSPNGGMIGSDIAMAWVNRNGSAMVPQFSDRFAPAERLPTADKHQDFFDVVVRA